MTSSTPADETEDRIIYLKIRMDERDRENALDPRPNATKAFGVEYAFPLDASDEAILEAAWGLVKALRDRMRNEGVAKPFK